jgi:hypothetical protein
MKNQILINNVRHAVSAGVALGLAFLVAAGAIFIGLLLLSLLARAFGIIAV